LSQGRIARSWVVWIGLVPLAILGHNPLHVVEHGVALEHSISFERPLDIEQELRGRGTDISGEARVAFLVELYRQERITHQQLTEALGLSLLETDGVLKRHKVSPGPTLEELRAEIGSLRDVTPE
jgi:predicted HTH domain antitoxin